MLPCADSHGLMAPTAYPAKKPLVIGPNRSCSPPVLWAATGSRPYRAACWAAGRPGWMSPYPPRSTPPKMRPPWAFRPANDNQEKAERKWEREEERERGRERGRKRVRERENPQLNQAHQTPQLGAKISSTTTRISLIMSTRFALVFRARTGSSTTRTFSSPLHLPTFPRMVPSRLEQTAFGIFYRFANSKKASAPASPAGASKEACLIDMTFILQGACSIKGTARSDCLIPVHCLEASESGFSDSNCFHKQCHPRCPAHTPGAGAGVCFARFD